MKYRLNDEFKSLSLLSGSLVGRFYPLLNVGYSFFKCKSDENVNVTDFLTPGYGGKKLSTLVIEPKGCNEKLPCIVFFYGGGFLLKTSKAHYLIAKQYAIKANCKVVVDDYRLLPENRYPVAKSCYGICI